MSRNLIFIPGYLSLPFFLFIFFSCNANGQGFSDVAQKSFFTPNFNFTDFVRTDRHIKSTENRIGCKMDVVDEWKASGGKFKFFNENGTVIEGRIQEFFLKGKMSSLRSPCPFLLEIEKLKVIIILDSPFTVNAYGGIVSLDKNQTIEISNLSSITISQNLPPNPPMTRLDGTFAVKTSNKLDWSNAKFNFQELPNTISLNLVSNPSALKEFEIPIKTGIPIITKAQFNYTLPIEVKNQTFSLNTSNYRAKINSLGLENCLISLTRNGLTLQLQNFSGSGEMTAKSNTTSPIPILFNGNASIQSLKAIADFSLIQAEMKDVNFSGLKLRPVKDVSERLATNLPISLENKSRKDQIVGQNSSKSPQQFQLVSFQPNKSQFKEYQTSIPLCYQTSPGQLADIKELSMSSLTDRQTEAIRISKATLDRIDTADFLIHLPSKDLDKLIEDFGLKDFRQLLDIQFGNQTILLCGDFSSFAELLNLPKVLTKITLKVSPTFEVADVDKDGQTKKELALVLRYEVCQANLGNTDNQGQTSPKEIVQAINKQIGAAVSETIKPSSKVVIPLPLDFVKPLDFNRSKNDTKGNKFEVKAKKLKTTISPIPDMTVIFVDVKGIHILGKVSIKVEEK